MWIGLAAGAFFIFKLLGAALTPFFAAAVIAYTLAPAVRWLHRSTRRRLPRAVCALLVELTFLTASLTLLLLVVPILHKILPLLRQQLPLLIEQLCHVVNPLLARLGIEAHFAPAMIRDTVVEYLQINGEALLESALPSLKIGGSWLISVLGYMVLGPLLLFYFLLEWDKLVQRVKGLIPLAYLERIRSFVQEADDIVGHYLRGQLLVMGLLALYYTTALKLWGLDLGIPIGALTGLAVWIPYVGFATGLVLALLAGLIQFGFMSTVIAISCIYGAGQIIESFVLTPRLVGERIGLHPLAVIFALIAFGDLFGFVGLLVALPVSAILLLLLRRLHAGCRAAAATPNPASAQEE